MVIFKTTTKPFKWFVGVIAEKKKTLFDIFLNPYRKNMLFRLEWSLNWKLKVL